MAKPPSFTATVYNLQGEKTGEMSLDESVFAVEVKPIVVQTVALAQRAAAHQPFAHAKTRAEKRGGGKKPWKQKGTGRARHGSSRSPLWRGGGVTFGPSKDRNMMQKVNKKLRKSAIRMCLSDKAAEQMLFVIDSVEGLEGKTKQLALLMNKLPTEGRGVLIASGEKNEKLRLAAQNLDNVNTVLADSVNVLDLLKYRYLVVDKAGVEKMTTHFA